MKIVKDSKFDIILSLILLIIIMVTIIILFFVPKQTILDNKTINEYKVSIDNLNADFESLRTITKKLINENEKLMFKIEDLEFELDQQKATIKDWNISWDILFRKN